MRMKEESEKAGLKLNIQKEKIMASGPITSRQTEEEKVQTVTDFTFLSSKITVDGNCSHKIKKMLAPWKESYDKPLLFSRSVVSDPLRPHGLQHARLSCPSLSPRVCSNSCPLSR